MRGVIDLVEEKKAAAAPGRPVDMTLQFAEKARLVSMIEESMTSSTAAPVQDLESSREMLRLSRKT